MQMKYLHKSIYKLSRYRYLYDESNNRKHPYYKVVHKWELLKSEGVSDSTASEVTGISRATFYRYRRLLRLGRLPGKRRPEKFRRSNIPEATRQLILSIREENPTYGKYKIMIILRRDHATLLSESSVGRVLKHYMDLGKIERSASAGKMRRRVRRFNRHAKRWPYGLKGKSLGEMIQVDHMSVSKNNVSLKHFQAWDPMSKTIVAEAYTSASSHRAKAFLALLIERLPFPVKSIQVDGGSEFMGVFEEACAALDIPLYVLPPKSPKYNGGVERGNRIFREEFYARDDLLANDIGEMQQALSQAVNKYNTYRPHFALKGLTPSEYTQKSLEAAA